MATKETGTLESEGQVEPRIDHSQSVEDNYDGMKTLDEVEGESDSEQEVDEQGDDDGESSEEEQDYSGLEKITDEQYKEMERYVSKTRDELSDLKSSQGVIEGALAKYGGLEKALQLVDFVSSDPDFKKLIETKSRGQSAIDESAMSPDAKEAMKIVRDVAKEVVSAEINQLRRDTIDPHLKAVNDRNLDVLATQMTDKFGDDWLEYADEMQGLAENLSVTKRNNLDLEDIEGLYIVALNRAGKLDKFSTIKKQVKDKKKIEKSTPRTRTTSVDTNKPEGKPRDIFEAAQRAAKKHGIKF